MGNFKNSLDDFCTFGKSVNNHPITAKASGKSAEINLYGVIGGYTANLAQFKRDLDAAGKADNITIYLNTIGGSFADGLPIHNLIKQHPAFITVKIMGYALSIGSVIMLAANRVECAENGLVMIHRAQGFTYGDAADHQKNAEILQKHEQAVIPAYARRLGKTEGQVLALLQDETWYTAKEAKAAGLVDAITNEADMDKAEETAGMQGEGLKLINAYRNRPATLIQRGHYS